MKFLTFFNIAFRVLFGAGLVLGLVQTGAAQTDSSRWVTEAQLSELVDPALLPPGASVDVKFVKADERIGSLQCPAALFANTAGNKMWGRTYVRVQCVGSDTAPSLWVSM